MLLTENHEFPLKTKLYRREGSRIDGVLQWKIIKTELFGHFSLLNDLSF